MNENYKSLKEEFFDQINKVADLKSWNALRLEMLGKSGKLTMCLRGLGKVPADERKQRGQELNQLRNIFNEEIESCRINLQAKALNDQLEKEKVDITIPPAPSVRGVLHPIHQAIEEISRIFATMDFEVKSGPDIDTDWFNFSALNTPPWHPARTEQDTFYLPSGDDASPPHVLRTQTSGVQIRTLLEQSPPFRMIAPGRVYRADHDATHSPMFHQCEGLAVGENITMSHLKGCLRAFLQLFFKMQKLPLRFRSSYFPFTEPSLEVDIGWSAKTGKIGQGDDWLEVLGAGMVHPHVLANCGVDFTKWQGFAFGVGIERLVMLRDGITDLRAFYGNDTRWLRAFGSDPAEDIAL